MPYHFYRQASDNPRNEDVYSSTVVGNDSSWALLPSADFLVFDQKRGLELLGEAPSYEYMFAVNDGMISQLCYGNGILTTSSGA
jgi:hypothetical protein